MDFLPKVEDNIIEDEPTSDDEPTEPIKSTQITEEDIFNPKPKLVIKEVIEEPISDEPILHESEDIGGLDVEVVEPLKEIPKVKPVKKKRVLSEAHKQKLAQARVKALETRRENAKIRKEKKELEKAIKDKELEALREKAGIRKPKKVTMNVKPVVHDIAEQKKEEEPQPVFDMKQSYTKEDIEKASLNAIMSYEKIRKQRKAKKREEQEKNKHEIQLKRELTQRIMPQTNSNVMYGQNGYWDNCF